MRRSRSSGDAPASSKTTKMNCQGERPFKIIGQKIMQHCCNLEKSIGKFDTSRRKKLEEKDNIISITLGCKIEQRRQGAAIRQACIWVP